MGTKEPKSTRARRGGVSKTTEHTVTSHELAIAQRLAKLPIRQQLALERLSAAAADPGRWSLERWPALGRKGTRAARKSLTGCLDRILGDAFTKSFHQAYEASWALKYPRSSSQFLQMWFKAIERQVAWRENGSGVRR